MGSGDAVRVLEVLAMQRAALLARHPDDIARHALAEATLATWVELAAR